MNSKSKWIGWLALMILGICIQSSAQVWTPMGFTPATEPLGDWVYGAGLTIGPGGIPYIAYSDDADSDRVTVRKYVGGTWVNIGPRGFTTDITWGCQIVVDGSGTPYVLYFDETGPGHMVVAVYSGGSWISLGTGSLYSGNTLSGFLAIDASGNPWLSFQDSMGHTRVMEYTGSSWSYIGGPVTIGNTGNSTLAIDPSGVPYVAYVDYTNGAGIRKYSGGSWVQVGTLTANAGSVYAGIGISISTSGTPYIAYTDGSNTGAHVLYFTGSAWTDVGSPGFTTATTGGGRNISVDASGNVYVVLNTYNGQTLTVMKYDGSSWSTQGSTGSVAAAGYVTIASDASGDSYLIWSSSVQTVLKYNGSSWQDLGNEGLTDATGSGGDIISDHSGNVYMAYQTGGNHQTQITVSQYTGSTWTALPISINGSAYLPFENGTLAPNLAVDDHDVLYMSYTDSLSDVYVKKYVSGAWVDATVPLSGLVYYDSWSLKISPSGTPYIGFIDYRNNINEAVRVMRYSGGAWSYLDTLSLVAIGSHNMSFDVDQYDSVYVAFNDSLGTGIYVEKYNGSTWSQIGNFGNTNSYLNQLSLDTSGSVYVLYDSAGGSNMRKFNGSSWDFVGTPGFISRSTSGSFALDGSDRPYVMYIDPSNNYKAAVKEYDGSSWVDLQLQNYTYNNANGGSSIAVSPSGTVYAAFSSSGVFAYQYSPLPDSVVWPGDADANHIVDNTDLLPIGLGYAATGPVRTVTGIVWQGDVATDWSSYFTTYAPLVNYKHADCNGDGTINASDTAAILANFGLVHTKTGGYNGPWRNGAPVLGLTFSADTVYDGQALVTDIYLGDSALPASNIYGLAFTLNYDPIVDSSNTQFSFLPSWLGDSTNSINISRSFAGAGQVKAAITGINHLPRSGSGNIATFTAVITTGNINGKDYSYYANYSYISDITAIDQHGNIIILNAGIDSNYVGYYPTGIATISGATISISPNPAANILKVSADAALSEITITDMLGRNAKTILSNKTTETVDISDLTPGIYSIRVSTQHGSLTSKLVISR